MSSTSPERPNDRALAGLRIAVGAFFLIFGSYKVLWTGFTLHGGFQKWITGWLADGSAYPFMAPVLRDFVLPQLGHVQLCRLTKEDVRGLRLWLERTSGLSPATVLAILSDLRCLLLWCVDAGYMERSPFPRRVMPRLQERPPDRLTVTGELRDPGAYMNCDHGPRRWPDRWGEFACN